MTNHLTATLALDDGEIFHGQPFGAEADTVFELVFNTSLTGYQEIITDPSYRGQGVLFTASHIGNVGINSEDRESEIPQVMAVMVREVSPVVSNWRSAQTLPDWLAQHNIPGISGIDTRYLTRKLRDQGVMKAALSTRGTPPAQLIAMAREWPGLDGRDMVREVTSRAIASWDGDEGSKWIDRVNPTHPGEPPHVVLYDFGAKRNIARHLAALGLRVTIVPAYTTCSEAMALAPDGFLLSNGPGDPAGLPRIAGTVRDLIETGLPIFGICLGHQLIGRAVGGETIKLKFGHHSANHPVLDLRTHKVQVTSQNHNYAVAVESLDSAEVEVTHRSLNDGTIEGMRLINQPVFSVQYHPEASPGPHDAHGLFEQFIRFIRRIEEEA